MKSIGRFIRKYLQCKLFDVHWRMKYDSGIPNHITKGGVCQDCNYRREPIERPKCPPRPIARPPSGKKYDHI